MFGVSVLCKMKNKWCQFVTRKRRYLWNLEGGRRNMLGCLSCRCCAASSRVQNNYTCDLLVLIRSAWAPPPVSGLFSPAGWFIFECRRAVCHRAADGAAQRGACAFRVRQGYGSVTAYVRTREDRSNVCVCVCECQATESTCCSRYCDSSHFSFPFMVNIRFCAHVASSCL